MPRVWKSGQAPRPEAEIEEPTGHKQEGSGAAVVSGEGGGEGSQRLGLGHFWAVWEAGGYFAWWGRRGQSAQLRDSQVLFYHF